MNAVTDIMRRATAAHGKGNYPLALREAQGALKLAPGNPAILQFLGVVECQSGQPRRGLAWLMQALQLAPGNADLRLNAAKAALDSGDPAQARELAAPLGQSPQGARLLAEIARISGDTAGLLAGYEQALRAAPNDRELLNNYGNALNEAGRASDAVAVLERAAAIPPPSAQVLLNLGRAQAASEQHEAALATFRRAAALGNGNAEVHFELGKSLLRHGDHEQALLQLAEAARAGKQTGQVFVLIGLSYAALEQRPEAERAYRMALHVEPASSRAWLNLAILLEQENRIDELRQTVTDAHKACEPGPDLDYMQALVLRRDGQFAEALALVEGTASDSLDPMLRAQFIGQAADRLGEIDKAFAAFAEMNAIMAFNPEARAFDGTEHSASITARTAIVTPEWFASWPPPVFPDDRPSPAFLGGVLRSGTTLLDTILMGHSGTHVREEEPMIARLEEAAGAIAGLPAMGSADVARLRDAYFAELALRGELPAGKLLIDKYPLFTLRAAYLHRAFPDARHVFTLRHPCDVVLSCWMQNFRITRAMASFLTLENAARLYDAVMTHWMRACEVMPLKVHTVRYEDMVEDLEATLRPMIAFLGLEWDDRLLDYQDTARERGYIRTPSYAQVTEQVYTRSRGRWELYRAHMAPVLDVLAPWAIRFGYGDPREG